MLAVNLVLSSGDELFASWCVLVPLQAGRDEQLWLACAPVRWRWQGGGRNQRP
jgi:hypothetical protein